MIKGSITVKPQAFAAAVKWAAGFVQAKPTIPIHAGIKLDAEGGTLTVTAFSEYVSAVASLDYTGDGSGVAVVSGRLVKELAGTFGKADVTISGDEDGVLGMASGRWAGTLPTMNEADYPDIPDVPAAAGEVAGDEFARAAAEVAAAVSDDPTKQSQWRCIHLTFGDGKVRIMGTDAHRAAGVTVTFTGTCEPASALVLGGQLEEVAAGLAGPDAIAVGIGGTQISLSSRTRSVVLNTMAMSDGDKEYPVDMVTKFLGWQSTDRAVVKVADLVVPLKRAAVMRDKEGPVAVRFSSDTITIVSTAEGRKGDEDVDVDYSGPEATLYFNPQYFADGLTSAPGDEVEIAFDSQNHPNGNPKPVVMTVAGSSWRHVMQPIKPLR